MTLTLSLVGLGKFFEIGQFFPHKVYTGRPEIDDVGGIIVEMKRSVRLLNSS